MPFPQKRGLVMTIFYSHERSVDFRFGRFATSPIEKVFLCNEILSGLGEPASSAFIGGPRRMDGVGTGGDATFGSRLIQRADLYIRFMVKSILSKSLSSITGEFYQGYQESTILAEESIYSQMMKRAHQRPMTYRFTSPVSRVPHLNLPFVLAFVLSKLSDVSCVKNVRVVLCLSRCFDTFLVNVSYGCSYSIKIKLSA
jgi:hypothetical protein